MQKLLVVQKQTLVYGCNKTFELLSCCNGGDNRLGVCLLRDCGFDARPAGVSGLTTSSRDSK